MPRYRRARLSAGKGLPVLVRLAVPYRSPINPCPISQTDPPAVMKEMSLLTSAGVRVGETPCSYPSIHTTVE